MSDAGLPHSLEGYVADQFAKSDMFLVAQSSLRSERRVQYHLKAFSASKMISIWLESYLPTSMKLIPHPDTTMASVSKSVQVLDLMFEGFGQRYYTHEPEVRYYHLHPLAPCPPLIISQVPVEKLWGAPRPEPFLFGQDGRDSRRDMEDIDGSGRSISESSGQPLVPTASGYLSLVPSQWSQHTNCIQIQNASGRHVVWARSEARTSELRRLVQGWQEVERAIQSVGEAGRQDRPATWWIHGDDATGPPTPVFMITALRYAD
ncbi:hypothetical protein FPV67DRAFT_1447019 [Lyophyllum atratum]|nr:hypothetical protein FPV67DRAFT_1447019 [Lyophyllum atratum]